MLHLHHRSWLGLCSLLFWTAPTWGSLFSHFHWFGNCNTQFGGIVQSPILIRDGYPQLYKQPLADFNLAIGIYQKTQLAYVSLQCKAPKINLHHLENSILQSVSLGTGYRMLFNSTSVIGSYCFLDFGFYGTDKTCHLNLGLEATFHLWRGHFNGYIPRYYPYETKFLNALLPTSFTLNGSQLEQHYFLEKGNFSWDAKLVRERAFFNCITPAIGIYHCYDRYMQQNIWGGLFNLEYAFNSKWCVYFQLSYDNTHTYISNIGCKWNALGGYKPHSSSYYQRLHLPHERHLAPRFIQTRGVRSLTNNEAEKWQRYADFKASEARQSKEYKKRQVDSIREEQTRVDNAYKFLKTMSGDEEITIDNLIEMSMDQLNSWYKKNVALKIHPNSTNKTYTDEQKTALSQALSMHLDILAKKGRIPPTTRYDDEQ